MRPRKTVIEGADVTCWGRLFQVRAAVTRKAWSPTVESRVWRTFSDSEEADRRRLRASKSAVYSSSSARYDGAVPCRHSYTSTAFLDHPVLFLRNSKPQGVECQSLSGCVVTWKIRQLPQMSERIWFEYWITLNLPNFSIPWYIGRLGPSTSSIRAVHRAVTRSNITAVSNAIGNRHCLFHCSALKYYWSL